MNKRCILFYNRGNKCIIKLLVSIASLKKHYNDDIVVVLEGKQEKYLTDRLKKLNVNIIEVEQHKVNNALAVKPSLYKYVTNYRQTLYLDSDTVVIKPLDEIFHNIKKYGLVFTQFSNWKTNVKGSVQRRIEAWRPVFDEETIQKAIGYGKAVNTGVFGWSKGYTESDYNIFQRWFDVTLEGQEKKCVTRMVDEIAAQCLLPLYPHKMLDQRFNYSVKHATLPIDNAVVAHFHGYKECYVDEYEACKLWQKQYLELVKSKFIGINDVFTNRRLRNAPWRKNLIWKMC